MISLTMDTYIGTTKTGRKTFTAESGAEIAEKWEQNRKREKRNRDEKENEDG